MLLLAIIILGVAFVLIAMLIVAGSELDFREKILQSALAKKSDLTFEKAFLVGLNKFRKIKKASFFQIRFSRVALHQVLRVYVQIKEILLKLFNKIDKFAQENNLKETKGAVSVYLKDISDFKEMSQKNKE